MHIKILSDNTGLDGNSRYGTIIDINGSGAGITNTDIKGGVGITPTLQAITNKIIRIPLESLVEDHGRDIDHVGIIINQPNGGSVGRRDVIEATGDSKNDRLG